MTDYIVRAYRGDRNWYRRIADYAKVVAEQPGQPPAFERAKDLRRELSERASRNGWTRITVEPNAPRKDTAMTDPTPAPPSGDAADSQQADSEVADCWLTGSQVVAILNTSRRFLLELADARRIDVGVDLSGRRVYSARSVQAYKERDDQQRSEAADELSRLGQEIEAAPLTADSIAAIAAQSREVNDDLLDTLKADVIAASHEQPDGTGIRPTMAPYLAKDAAPFDAVANLTAGAEYIRRAYADRAPSAYQRGMQIAAGRAADPAPDLDAFRVAVTRGERWPIDRIGDDHLDLLYTLIHQHTADLRAVMERGNPETWERQANEIGRLVHDLQNSQQEATGARDELSDLRLRLHRLADDLAKPSHANIPPHMIAGSIWGAIEAPPLHDTTETT